MMGASSSELLRGSKHLKDYGITEGQGIKAWQNDISGIVKAYAPLDPQVKAELEANGGDYSKLDKSHLSRILQHTKAYGTDTLADAAAGMFQTVSGFKNPGAPTEQELEKVRRQYGDGAAFASINLEEQTKARLVGEEVAKHLAPFLKGLNAEAIVKAMIDAEKDGKNYDVKEGRRFLVEIIKPMDGKSWLPPNPRK